MNKSFIERIFPHPLGSRTHSQYEDDHSDTLSQSAATPPSIVLQGSASSSPSPTRQRASPVIAQPSRRSSASLVRHNDPFLPIERAAKNLERTLQSFLDAQAEGLTAGALESDDLSSVGSPTPTPSVATSPVRSTMPKTIPIRQPKPKKITLRGARKGLEKSMREFAALKDWELSLIDKEVVTRDEALKQASNLSSHRQALNDEINKIKSEAGPSGLTSEVQLVEAEIQKLEATLFELRSRHRILKDQLRQIESSKDSELSSYTESLALSERQIKTFLRHPPVQQSLDATHDAGMYAFKPDRRTLQMAQEQWSGEVESLGQRKSNVEKEKIALEEGVGCWAGVVERVRAFEKELRDYTIHLSSQSSAGTDSMTEWPNSTEDASLKNIIKSLSVLVTSLEQDLEHAGSKNWNLLVCAIGAELSALEQARDLLGDTRPENDDLIDGSDGGLRTEDNVMDAIEMNGGHHSPASSNPSLEDTLRQFADPRCASQSEQGPQVDNGPGPPWQEDRNGRDISGSTSTETSAPRPKMSGRSMTTESEDDEPGPEFLLSHS
jgi:hypothetical protein